MIDTYRTFIKHEVEEQIKRVSHAIEPEYKKLGTLSIEAYPIDYADCLTVRLSIIKRQASPIHHHAARKSTNIMLHVVICTLRDDGMMYSPVLRCGRLAPPSIGDRVSPGLSEQDISLALIHSAWYSAWFPETEYQPAQCCPRAVG